MTEAANILGVLPLALLLLAAIAWVKLVRGPALQGADGHLEMVSGQGEFPSSYFAGAPASAARRYSWPLPG